MEREQAPPRPPRRNAPPAGSVVSEPQAITLQSPAPAAAAADARAASAPALDLSLPRKAGATAGPQTPAALAARDSRSSTDRAGFGDTLARRLGTDPRITDENRGEGRWRIRQGSHCVDLRDARSTAIDPIGQATRPAPKVGEACP